MNRKIQVTAQQRANALEALNVMWPSVPERNVYPNLSEWRLDSCYNQAHCGTVACFGGWCEVWPNFRQQAGLSYKNIWDSWERLAALFSRNGENLFAPRGGHPADAGFSGTDHALVTNRLNWLIANSEVIE
jgi:hypothetical protein